MPTQLETLFTPADFEQLRNRDLSCATCVVFDVLRATSSMVAALFHDADAIIPVSEIDEALELYRKDPHLLLAGERDGIRIAGHLAQGTDFHLGNSPREFTTSKVSGKTIVMTTTNGTRALKACAGAKHVLVSSLLNIGITAEFLLSKPPETLLLVCGGTYDEAAYEDILAAGCLADALWPNYQNGAIGDSNLVAREIYQHHRKDLFSGLARGRNGRRLLSRPELCEDVAFCATMDSMPMVAVLNLQGKVAGSVTPQA